MGSVVAPVDCADSQPGSMPIGFVPVFLVVLPVLVWRTTVSWNRKVILA